MTDLPYDFYMGSAIVYNGEIYIIGGYYYEHHDYYYESDESSCNYGKDSYIIGSKNFYKWDGSTWTSVNTLPHRIYHCSSVVYNEEIHIIGGYGRNDDVSYTTHSGYYSWHYDYSVTPREYKKFHYKWDGTSWTSVSTLPYYFHNGSAVVYNGEIHILGGEDSKTNHYKWDGSTWTSVSTLPYDFYGSSAVVYNGEIHILGSLSSTCHTNHYKWNGSTWTSVSTLPKNGLGYGSAVVYNGEIHILGDNSDTTNHYKWNGSTWSSVSTLPYNFRQSSAVVYNGKSIYILGGDEAEKSYAAFTSPEKLFNPYTLIIQRGNTSSGVYQTCFSDTFSKIEGENNRLLTGFDDIWYFLETKLDTTSPVYYGDGTKWIKLKN